MSRERLGSTQPRLDLHDPLQQVHGQGVGSISRQRHVGSSARRPSIRNSFRSQVSQPESSKTGGATSPVSIQRTIQRAHESSPAADNLLHQRVNAMKSQQQQQQQDGLAATSTGATQSPQPQIHLSHNNPNPPLAAVHQSPFSASTSLPSSMSSSPGSVYTPMQTSPGGFTVELPPTPRTPTLSFLPSVLMERTPFALPKSFAGRFKQFFTLVFSLLYFVWYLVSVHVIRLLLYLPELAFVLLQQIILLSSLTYQLLAILSHTCKWSIMAMRLIIMAASLTPMWCVMMSRYLCSGRVIRGVRYGPNSRNFVDIYLPDDCAQAYHQRVKAIQLNEFPDHNKYVGSSVKKLLHTLDYEEQVLQLDIITTADRIRQHFVCRDPHQDLDFAEDIFQQPHLQHKGAVPPNTQQQHHDQQQQQAGQPDDPYDRHVPQVELESVIQGVQSTTHSNPHGYGHDADFPASDMYVSEAGESSQLSQPDIPFDSHPDLYNDTRSINSMFSKAYRNSLNNIPSRHRPDAGAGGVSDMTMTGSSQYKDDHDHDAVSVDLETPLGIHNISHSMEPDTESVDSSRQSSASLMGPHGRHTDDADREIADGYQQFINYPGPNNQQTTHSGVLRPQTATSTAYHDTTKHPEYQSSSYMPTSFDLASLASATSLYQTDLQSVRSRLGPTPDGHDDLSAHGDQGPVEEPLDPSRLSTLVQHPSQSQSSQPQRFRSDSLTSRPFGLRRSLPPTKHEIGDTTRTQEMLHRTISLQATAGRLPSPVETVGHSSPQSTDQWDRPLSHHGPSHPQPISQTPAPEIRLPSQAPHTKESVEIVKTPHTSAVSHGNPISLCRTSAPNGEYLRTVLLTHEIYNHLNDKDHTYTLVSRPTTIPTKLLQQASRMLPPQLFSMPAVDTHHSPSSLSPARGSPVSGQSQSDKDGERTHAIVQSISGTNSLPPLPVKQRPLLVFVPGGAWIISHRLWAGWLLSTLSIPHRGSIYDSKASVPRQIWYMLVNALLYFVSRLFFCWHQGDSVQDVKDSLLASQPSSASAPGATNGPAVSDDDDPIAINPFQSNSINQVLLDECSDGFVCMSIDYRNFPQGTISDMVTDITNGISWALNNKHLYGANKVFVMGQSAGAHILLLAALQAYTTLKQKSDRARKCPAPDEQEQSGAQTLASGDDGEPDIDDEDYEDNNLDTGDACIHGSHHNCSMAAHDAVYPEADPCRSTAMPPPQVIASSHLQSNGSSSSSFPPSRRARGPSPSSSSQSDLASLTLNPFPCRPTLHQLLKQKQKARHQRLSHLPSEWILNISGLLLLSGPYNVIHAKKTFHKNGLSPEILYAIMESSTNEDLYAVSPVHIAAQLFGFNPEEINNLTLSPSSSFDQGFFESPRLNASQHMISESPADLTQAFLFKQGSNMQPYSQSQLHTHPHSLARHDNWQQHSQPLSAQSFRSSTASYQAQQTDYNIELFRSTSSKNPEYVSNHAITPSLVFPPIFLMHGTNDKTVDCFGAFQMFHLLKHYGHARIYLDVFLGLSHTDLLIELPSLGSDPLSAHTQRIVAYSLYKQSKRDSADGDVRGAGAGDGNGKHVSSSMLDDADYVDAISTHLSPTTASPAAQMVPCPHSPRHEHEAIPLFRTSSYTFPSYLKSNLSAELHCSAHDRPPTLGPDFTQQQQQQHQQQLGYLASSPHQSPSLSSFPRPDTLSVIEESPTDINTSSALYESQYLIHTHSSAAAAGYTTGHAPSVDPRVFHNPDAMHHPLTGTCPMCYLCPYLVNSVYDDSEEFSMNRPILFCHCQGIQYLNGETILDHTSLYHRMVPRSIVHLARKINPF